MFGQHRKNVSNECQNAGSEVRRAFRIVGVALIEQRRGPRGQPSPFGRAQDECVLRYALQRRTDSAQRVANELGVILLRPRACFRPLASFQPRKCSR
jgi:hypothetical protein